MLAVTSSLWTGSLFGERKARKGRERRGGEPFRFSLSPFLRSTKRPVHRLRGKLVISTGTLLNHYKLKNSHLDWSESYLSLIIMDGGRGCSSRPWDRRERGGWSQKHFFFRPFGPQFGLRIRWGGLCPPGPSPGYPLPKQIYYCFGLHRFIDSGKMKLLGFTFC